MKRLLFTVTLTAATLFSTHAQCKKIYGPKAKNTKVWIHNTSSDVVVENNKAVENGAVAKNEQTWISSSKEVTTADVMASQANMPLNKKLAEANYERKQVMTNGFETDHMDVQLTEVND